MSKVTSSWARPIQGVSQQPPKIMKDGQCRVCDNMIPSVVSGLMKRTGTDHIAKVLNSLEPNAKIHHYVRDGVEEYFVIFESNGIPKVFGIDGRQHNVTVNHGSSYCTHSNAKSGLAMQTIADYTFIVNKDKTVAALPATTPTLVEEAIVYVQYAFYGRRYQILIDGGVVAEYHTPDGSVSTHIDLVATGYVRSQLMSGTVWQGMHASGGAPVYDDYGPIGLSIDLPINADVTFFAVGSHQYVVGADGVERTSSGLYIPGDFPLGSTIDVYYKMPTAGGLSYLTDFVCTQYGDSIHIKRVDGAPFTIRTEDGAQGKDLIAVKGEIRSVGELPPFAPEGFMVKVRGAGKREDEAFWVKAVDHGGNNTIWAECPSPGMKTSFDPDTMPHTLIRESVDGTGLATFVLDRGTWNERDVGDDTSNPFPSFTDGQIKSVGVFQNRLYFTSGEAVSMTRTGRFFNFFRESTQVSAEDDPIDVYSDSNQVNTLLHSVSLDGDLVFFSSGAQFLMKGDKPLTRSNATLKQTNTFKVQTAAAPVPAGEYVYFAYDAGAFSGVREYFTDSAVDTKRARPVTEHVDRYIKGKVRGMSASTNQNWLLVLATGEMNVVYVYNWLWVNNEKVQSAWHRWVWPSDEEVLYATFSNDVIYLFIKRSEGVFLESLDIGDLNSQGLTFPVRLDRKRLVTATRSGDKWVFPDPYPEESADNLEYVLSTYCYPEDIGTTCVFERQGGIMVTYDNLGPGSSCALICGRKYTSTWVPNQPTVKDAQGRVIESDTLRLSQAWLNYEKTGHLLAKVSDVYGNEEVNEFDGRVFGDVNNVVGFAPLIDGTFNFPIMQDADKVTIQISSDSHLPLQIRDMEWSGQFTQRGRRI